MTTERLYPDTIAAPVAHEFVLKKSRFLTHVSPVASIADAESFISGLKKQYWDATHNCSAMVTGVLGDQARSSDDGEPSGTAGIPMLEVLRRRELTDLVTVVTRFYGGVKLGAGGLVRAYSTAVSETLDLARLVHRRQLRQVTVDVPHADAGRFDNLFREWVSAHGATLGETTYGHTAQFELWIAPPLLAEFDAALASASAGALTGTRGEDRIVDVPA